MRPSLIGTGALCALMAPLAYPQEDCAPPGDRVHIDLSCVKVDVVAADLDNDQNISKDEAAVYFRKFDPAILARKLKGDALTQVVDGALEDYETPELPERRGFPTPRATFVEFVAGRAKQAAMQQKPAEEVRLSRWLTFSRKHAWMAIGARSPCAG